MAEEIKDKTLIYLKREFPCSAEELFKAFLKEELFSKWFCPPGFEAGNFKISPFEGGGYNCEFLKEGKHVLTIKGEYKEIKKFSRLIFTLMYDPDHSNIGKCIITVSFSGSDSETTLVLNQEINGKIESSGRTKGWEFMFGVLEKLIIK